MAKTVAKKTTAKKAPAKTSAKPAAKKPTASPAKKAPAKKSVAATSAKPKPAPKAAVAKPVAKPASAPAKPAKKALPVQKKEETKPAAAGLSAKQLEYFKNKLIAEKLRVVGDVEGIQLGNLKQTISDESGENSRYSYHLGDVASLSYGREFTMGLAERQQKYLEQVDDALQRIVEGTYGICKVTGEMIPLERLEEVPVAKYSVKGKEMLDRRKRMGLD